MTDMTDIKEELNKDKQYITKDSGEREVFDTGAKRDVRFGKGRFDLIPPVAIKRLAELYERGSVKYGDNNFRKGMNTARFLDSCLRHINNYQMGDRSEDHLIAAIWNLIGIVDTQELIKVGRLDQCLDDLNYYG